jgi:hypothetical protein
MATIGNRATIPAFKELGGQKQAQETSLLTLWRKLCA